MKKLLSISIVLILPLLLTACGNTPENKSPESIQRTEKQTKETSQVNNSVKIPDWSKEIGAVEPKGLSVIPNTFKERDDNVKKSFEVKFTGKNKKLFSEAKRISNGMGLKIDWEDETEFLASKKLENGYLVTITVKTDTSKKFVDQPFLWYNIEKKK